MLLDCHKKLLGGNIRWGRPNARPPHHVQQDLLTAAEEMGEYY
jgi:hypothetical protein